MLNSRRLQTALAAALLTLAGFGAAPAFAQSLPKTCAGNSTQATCACPTTGPGVECFGGQIYGSDLLCHSDPRVTASPPTCTGGATFDCGTRSCSSTPTSYVFNSPAAAQTGYINMVGDITSGSKVTAASLQLTFSPGAGKTLVSDPTGNASWGPAPVSSQWATNGANIGYTAGRVGIGTTAPGYPLDIHSSSGTAEQRLNDLTGTSLWTGTAFARNFAERWFTGMKANNDDFVIQRGGATDALTISLASGNVTVGAGTLTTPMLRVTGGAPALGRVLTATNGSGDTTWSAMTSSQWSTNGTSVYYSGGNVGVGTSAPGFPLQVVGGAGVPFAATTTGLVSAAFWSSNSFNGFRVQTQAAGGVPYVAFDTGSATVGGGTQKAYLAYWGDSAARFSLGYNGSTDALNVSTAGATAGNVGIGDTSPAALLTVGNGDKFQVNASGAIAASAGYTQVGGGNFSYNNGVGAADFNTATWDISGSGAISGLTGFNMVSGGFSQAGTGTFGTGTGAVSLNGDVQVANGKNFAQIGAGTFSTGFGAVSLNGDVTVAAGKMLALGQGTAALEVGLAGGRIYYNTTWNKLRCYDAAAWKDCVPAAANLWTSTGSNIYYNAGNVGIGTTNPSVALAVGSGAVTYFSVQGATGNTSTGGTLNAAGNLSTSGSFTQSGAGSFSTGTGAVALNGDATLANGKMLVLGQATNAVETGALVGRMFYSITAGKFRCYEASAWKDCITAAGSGQWTTNVTHAYFNLAGNVGIGTGTTPAAKLEVAGNAFFGTTNKIKIDAGTGTYGSIQTTTAADDLVKRNTIINGWGGNVGIGTTTPGSRLTVNGSVESTGRYTAIGGATFTANGYSFNGGSGDTDGGMYSPADGTLVFATNNGERMRIQPSGNVGIANNNPGERLDVVGNVRATGYGWFDGTTPANTSGDLRVGEIFNDLGLHSASDNLQFDLGSASTDFQFTVGDVLKADIDGTTGNLHTVGMLDADANGAAYLCGGDDACLHDINAQGYMGIRGTTDSTKGGLQLGSGGVNLWGHSGVLDVGGQLDVYGTANVAGDINLSGAVSAKNGSPGTFLKAWNTEAAWFDGTTFSWGYGGSYNVINDWTRIGSTATPTTTLDVSGDVKISGSIQAGYGATFTHSNGTNVQIGSAQFYGFGAVITGANDYRVNDTKTAAVFVSGTPIGFLSKAANVEFLANGAGLDFVTSSSKRWKRNVQPLGNAMDIVSRLQGVTFDWDKDHGGKHDFGFIAEDLGAVVPELTLWDDGAPGYAIGVDYARVSPLLVEATKELHVMLNAQDGRAKALDVRVAELEREAKERDGEIDDLKARLERLEERLK